MGAKVLIGAKVLVRLNVFLRRNVLLVANDLLGLKRKLCQRLFLEQRFAQREGCFQSVSSSDCSSRTYNEIMPIPKTLIQAKVLEFSSRYESSSSSDCPTRAYNGIRSTPKVLLRAKIFLVRTKVLLGRKELL